MRRKKKNFESKDWLSNETQKLMLLLLLMPSMALAFIDRLSSHVITLYLITTVNKRLT